MRSRAERRHHRRRMMNKVKKFNWIEGNNPEHTKKRIRQIADNRKICSCEMCCNPRHSEWYNGTTKKTMQERRMDEYEKNLGIDDD